jgi:hypothetical protein
LKAGHSIVRNAKPDEFEAIGKLMAADYSQLEGFPGPFEQPAIKQNPQHETNQLV